MQSVSEVDPAAVMAECSRIRREMFYADRDYAIAKLSELNHAANSALLMLPEKFHAPFIASMAICQDAVRLLRADTRPPEYATFEAAAIEAAFLGDANEEIRGMGE